MYFLKDNVDTSHINKTKACVEIGITRPYLSFILNKKMGCHKTTAFCITKYLDKNAEIDDFFERKVK